jgi:hypothetical protein
VGPVASRGVPRAPRYSGAPRLPTLSVTGLSPSVVRFSNRFTGRVGLPYRCPQPRDESRFGLIRLRSPLLTESRFLSFPAVTEMFQFTAFALTPYTFRCEYRPKPVGFPIQKSQDQSLVTNSPGLIAGSHVFHRLLTPRHPPHALSSLITPTYDRSSFRLGLSASGRLGSLVSGINRRARYSTTARGAPH